LPHRRALFGLALKLSRSVGELEQISGREITEWLAYFDLVDSVDRRTADGMTPDAAWRSVMRPPRNG